MYCILVPHTHALACLVHTETTEATVEPTKHMYSLHQSLVMNIDNLYSCHIFVSNIILSLVFNSLTVHIFSISVSVIILYHCWLIYFQDMKIL